MLSSLFAIFLKTSPKGISSSYVKMAMFSNKLTLWVAVIGILLPSKSDFTITPALVCDKISYKPGFPDTAIILLNSIN